MAAASDLATRLTPAPWRGRATVLTYQAAGTVLPRIPDRLTVPAARAVARAMARLRAGDRAMALSHLERVGGVSLRGRRAEAALGRLFGNYARYWVEVFTLPSVPGTMVDDRMTVASGWEDLQAALDGDRGVILALPHLGAWEWGGRWLARLGHPMTAVAEELEPPELFDWFVRQRAAMGIDVVPLSQAGTALLRALRAGGLVGLVADRDLMGNGVPVTFFGETTTLPGGPATLALRTGAALFPAAVYQGPGHMHTAVILPAVDTARRGSLRGDVARITQDVAHGFEDLIGRAPEQWFCFQPNWPSERPGAGDGPNRQGRRQAS